MKRMGINILGLSKVRWTDSGKVTPNNHLQKEKALKGFLAISDRVILVKLHSKPMDANIIQVYAPTCDSSTEDIEDFYETCCKSYPGADCGSDHNPVIATVKQKLREAKPSKKLDLELLKTMPKVKEDFVYEVNNRFQVLAETNTTGIETEGRKIAESIRSAAEKTIPPKKRKRKKI
ncbi:hypothetical protein CAPTEDRAFT_212105 [Capitella teleta]|uniref:Endonuclease/exonuclease/phosphatase domain-containing protein n=1 Tax=Capitella teleta TaxID=283909 RepID=R7V9H6_CAPTE|nr:hypothetical protein CAPTEDRAFT_212105 [Capitella teleta]|eukprot:ELU12395.1 hypothetical protein CAPTEDRAFT_212105 [Capitella teleta]